MPRRAVFSPASASPGTFARRSAAIPPFGRKPDPTALLHLARSNGAEPGDTLMVGDSTVDRDTARAAGTRICLARYGFGFRIPAGDLLPTDLRIDSPLELISTVEALLR